MARKLPHSRLMELGVYSSPACQDEIVGMALEVMELRTRYEMAKMDIEKLQLRLKQKP